MTPKTLDNILLTWAESVVGAETVEMGGEYAVRAVKMTMYQGLRLLQMTQVAVFCECKLPGLDCDKPDTCPACGKRHRI